MMKKLRNSLVLAFTLLAIGFATACSDDDENTSNGWTDSQKTEYISECSAEPDVSEEQCECSFDKISAEYSYNELINIDENDADAFLAVGLLSLSCFF